MNTSYIIILMAISFQAPPKISDGIESHISQLGTFDSAVREKLVEYGNDAVPQLSTVLNDRNANDYARTEAALILGEIGGESVVDPLIGMLGDRRVAWSAIHALGEVGEIAKPSVLHLARIARVKSEKGSNEAQLSEMAEESIGKIGIGTKEAIDALTFRMTQNPNYQTALVLAKLGEAGAESLMEFAYAYSTDQRPENIRKYGDAYSVLAWGDSLLSPDMIPVFEKYILHDDERATIASHGLSCIGSPAKPILIKLLDHEDDRVRTLAAEGLTRMNFHTQAARRFRGENVKDPVLAEEVFPKLFALLQSSDGKVNYRILRAIRGIDREKALATEEYQQAMKIMGSEFLANLQTSNSQQYTVWVFKKVRNQWIKLEDRSFIGDKKTAQKYYDDVMMYSPKWKASSNLPMK